MHADEAAGWMLQRLSKEGCLYQDEVVDYLLSAGATDLTRENAEGNLVLGRSVLESFRQLTADSVVWVKSERYWRPRVPEDVPGRESSG